MMDTNLLIKQAEEKWYAPLYRHCRELFSGVFLPSHDHLHHSRVWSHARDLLLLLDESGAEIPVHLPEQLIIAVFFHDVGLSRTSGEEHGRESRLLCEDFFRAAADGLKKPGKESYAEILHAIEHHDDKTLKKGDSPDPSGTGLLRLLSAGDDLDAFGATGVYRYAEIYLLRGIEPEELPSRVSSNVKNRFENLKNTYRNLDAFIRKQEIRFRRVYDFYLSLAQAYAAGNEKPSWEPVLIEIIRESLARKKNLLDPGRILPATGFSAEIGDWFRMLDREIYLT